MQKRGNPQIKGVAAHTPWPAGAWARLIITRPIDHAAEHYLFGDEASIGRATNLAANDFRIDLQQVSTLFSLLFHASGTDL